MSIDFSLSPEELRILGCLMEKALTTPDQYPLTLNALTNACNQKSSREPVMSLDQGGVARAARQLEEKALISTSEGKSNVVKHTQRFCNTLLSELQFTPAEYAVVCLLMLRGPQTPGELRTRSARLHAFENNDEVKDVLQALMQEERGPLVARLALKPGRRDHEYTHLFAGEIDSVPEEPSVVESSPAISHKDDRLARLEARVSSLERALSAFAESLGEEINLDANE
jgi:uncharacterized protein YceH (UPF0502 family)